MPDDNVADKVYAFLEKPKLANKHILLSNPELREKAERIARSDRKISQYIKNQNRDWCTSIDDVVNREVAREFCAAGCDWDDMLVINGSLPFQTEPGKFIELVDSVSENSMRHDLGKSYRFGHNVYKFCSEPDDGGNIHNQRENAAAKCAPYKIYITREGNVSGGSGRNKIFEPYILEEVINKRSEHVFHEAIIWSKVMSPLIKKAIV
ncbi:hypothetical protein FACS189449_11130 [Alphaproteobacteria bacterium]|nr:hypothetical protein FACS189449_11130 [Alphaproteobacteria bacterium]